MNMHARSGISAWILTTATLAALVGLVMGGFGVDRAVPLAGARSSMSGTLVHWHDANHDWLVVGDGESDQLSIYNAADGSLVRRVAVRHGLNDANALAQRDGRLFVVGDDGQLGELQLPQLQMVAVNGP
ncbi:hypothetical protein [Rhodanobacter sp. BL-MT-08]